jgi:hypothetical protein
MPQRTQITGATDAQDAAIIPMPAAEDLTVEIRKLLKTGRMSTVPDFIAETFERPTQCFSNY